MWEADRRLGERIDQVGERIEQLAEESRAADKRLGERIDQFAGRVDSLVSAIGSLITSEKKPEGF